MEQSRIEALGTERGHIEELLRIVERGESPTLNLSLGPECAKFREEMKAFLLDQLREELQWEKRRRDLGEEGW